MAMGNQAIMITYYRSYVSDGTIKARKSWPVPFFNNKIINEKRTKLELFNGESLPLLQISNFLGPVVFFSDADFQ
jgi:hypothetical protein